MRRNDKNRLKLLIYQFLQLYGYVTSHIIYIIIYVRYQRKISEVDVKTKAEKMYRVFDDMTLDKFLLNI